MTSREKILAVVRSQRVPDCDLPELAGPWIEYPDRVKQFGEALAFVGGKLERAASVRELRAKIAELPAYKAAKQICSCVPSAAEGNVRIEDVADPHDLEAVDLVVLPGEFAVAENGAVWVSNQSTPFAGREEAVQSSPFAPREEALPAAEQGDFGGFPRHRVIYFLTQHLVLVVPASQLVNNMYEAYNRISFGGPSYGVFISGPSKTADIEQSLVIGAHGARSLTVFLVD